MESRERKSGFVKIVLEYNLLEFVLVACRETECV